MRSVERSLIVQPREVFEELRKVVVGQDEALREVAVAVVKHLAGHSAGNMLLIGNSGSGKTTIIKAVEHYLASRPSLREFSTAIRINANVLAESHDSPGTAVLGRLYPKARRELGPGASESEILRRIERGIVFVDEVDKIRSQVGGVPSVRGIVAQEALLTLIENENIEFTEGGKSLVVNSSSILFIAAGAFEELYDNVLRRATVGTDVVALKPVVVVSQTGEVREEVPFQLRDYLRHDDLFRYGMTPQFVSRFESIVVLNDLGEEDLATIFVEPEASIFRIARDYFRRFEIDLQITRGALLAIAWDASQQKRIGARALREVFRRIIHDLEFDPSRIPRDDGRRVVMIDEDRVRHTIAERETGKRR